MDLAQYRIIQVCGLHSKLFLQSVQTNRDKADASPRVVYPTDNKKSIKNSVFYLFFCRKIWYDEVHCKKGRRRINGYRIEIL